MSNKSWIIFDGKISPGGDRIIPAESRGLMYGDGCFATFRSYSGRFLKPEQQLKRLEQATRFLGMVFPEQLALGSVQGLLQELLVKNKLSEKEAVIRIQVWREGGRGYQPKRPSSAHFTITASEYAGDWQAKPVTLASVDIRRIPDQALPARFKLSNSINYITASGQAQAKGADDALMLTLDGHISETPIANIFWFKKGIVFTPSTECDLLPGITRSIILQVIEALPGYHLEEGRYRPEEVKNAEAVWICNSVREMIPVSRIDDRSFQVSHQAFEEIRQGFIRYRNQNLTFPE